MRHSDSRVVNEVIWVLAATTLVVALIDLYAEGFPAVVTESIAALQAEIRMSIPGLLGLTLLPIFYPIVDTTNWLRIAALEADPHSARIDAARTPEAFARVLGMYAGASALLWLLICVLARNDRSTRYGHAGGGRYPAVLRCAACFAAKRRSGCGLMAIARKRDCDGCVDDECKVFRNLSDHSVRHYSSRLAQPGAGLGAAARPGARGETHHRCRGAGSASDR